MSILSKLASTLGRRDEIPNQELARQIAALGDREAIRELVESLNHKNKDVRHDCIKVLYEAGKIQPNLLVNYTDSFLSLLKSRDNRMQWGAMTALSAVVREKPALIFKHLPQILDAADQGSVITKDQALSILVSLCRQQDIAGQVFPLLIEQLAKAATNQLPMYAENALPVVRENDKALFIETLRARLGEVEKESKKQRIEKVIRKLSK